MKQKWLDAARAVAIAGQGTGRRRSFRMGAVLLGSRGILAAKTNSYKTHPVLKEYSEWPFQHAESACIISHGMDHCEHLDLVVARVDRHNKLTMGRPCPTCERIIRDVGIRSVTYSNWEGQWETMSV